MKNIKIETKGKKLIKESYKQKVIDKNENKGITLIALVVTIIVMLILAGVTISTLVGENGLINKTIQAKEKNDEAAELEKIQLEIAQREIDNYETSGGSASAQVANEMFKESLNALGENPSSEEIGEVADEINSKLEKMGVSSRIIQITSFDDMKKIGSEEYTLDNVYILMDNITGGSFDPIGTEDEPFTGVLNGMNKTITGLKIEGEENVGLVAVNRGTITKLELIASSEENSVTSATFNVGSIAGQNYGEISECKNNGISVTGNGGNEEKDTNAGGIVGLNQPSGVIKNCENSGAVSATNNTAGGICGRNLGTITDASNYATVTAEGMHAGGITGVNIRIIENATNEGAIEAGSAQQNDGSSELWFSQVGGIAGLSGKEGSESVYIKECTNKGTITGAGVEIGGIVGCNYKGSTITNSKNEGAVESNEETATNVGGITGTNYASVEKCDNTGIISYSAVTKKDIYMGGVCGFNVGNISSCNNSGEIKAAYGCFIGGVVGIHRKTANSYLDVKVKECNNEGKITARNYTGGIVGVNYAAIETSNNKGELSYSGIVKEDAYLGGACGWNGGSILSCYNSGPINAEYGCYVGGIAGMHKKSASSYLDVKIEKCYNKGKITARNYIGGIAGQTSDSAAISISYNAGDIVADAQVGGITGRVQTNGTIQSCYNTASITKIGSAAQNFRNFGGICGVIVSDSGYVKNCYNSGAIFDDDETAGGIAGSALGVNNNGKVSYCYYLDTISIGVGDSGYSDASDGTIIMKKVAADLKATLTGLSDEFVDTTEYPILKWQA